MRLIRSGLAGSSALVLLLSGCVPTEFLAPQRTAAPPPAGEKVLTSGACLDLGEVERAGIDREQFLRHVEELLAANRTTTVRQFVRRYPDVALETLRHGTNDQAGSRALLTIAGLHDEQCGTAASGATWTALLQERAAHPNRYEPYEKTREQFENLLHTGKARDAVRLALTKGAFSPLLEVDAYQLVGAALLLSDKPGEAAAAFTMALDRARPLSAYQTAQLGLLLGEAQRRAGKIPEGTGSWQQAVLTASQMLNAPVPAFDPVFWERASYLRPASCSWPEPVLRQFVAAAGAFAEPPRESHSLDESWLWAAVGCWHLDRREPQAALAALKRSESLTLDPGFRDRLQLQQAQALIELDQTAAALALLVRLGGDATHPAASPALALLGGLKLKEGSSVQALALLKKAVEESPSNNWAGRGEAEADLGLAYLMTGNAGKGLEWLHAAQQRAEAARDGELLRQTLDNEARYFEHLNKADEAGRLRQRIQALEGT
jgi:tetratricopeptide (TPR) repeat protein